MKATTEGVTLTKELECDRPGEYLLKTVVYDEKNDRLGLQQQWIKLWAPETRTGKRVGAGADSDGASTPNHLRCLPDEACVIFSLLTRARPALQAVVPFGRNKQNLKEERSEFRSPA